MDTQQQEPGAAPDQSDTLNQPGTETPDQTTDQGTGGSQQADRFEDIAQEVKRISQYVQTSLAPKPEPVKQVSEAEIRELFKTDPTKAIDLLVQQRVHTSVTEKAKVFEDTNMRAEFDRRAESEFPILRTDKGFQEKVAAKVRELVSSGEYTRESPKLVYRATQLAALESGALVQRTRPAQGGGPTSEPPRSGAPMKTQTIPDTDQRVRVARMMGVKDIEGFKKDLMASDKAKAVGR